MRKLQVLYIGPKYHAANPKFGIGPVETLHLRTLEISGLATLNRFHLDEFFLSHRRPVTVELVEFCTRERPDLIILDWESAYDYNPKLEILGILSHQMNIPIVAIWWDLVWDIYVMHAEQLLPYVKLHVAVDTSSFFSKVSRPEKYLSLWKPINSHLFYNQPGERDIPISFIGRTVKTGRKEKIMALQKANIGFYHTGGLEENPITFEEMANIYRRSKIVVNFSASPTGHHQLVGRVMEATSCGAMLLEEDNQETRRFFEPMVDYVPYNGVEDLIYKARYYLKHENERATVAKNGCQKVTEKYNCVIFWKTFFSHVFGNRWENELRVSSNLSVGPLRKDELLITGFKRSDRDQNLEGQNEPHQEVSILIPTLNRSEYLIRALNYYRKVGFKGYICIGDSSDDQHAARIRQAVQTLGKQLKIVYHYFPKASYSPESMVTKELVELAPTPYLAFSGDDDFLVPASLGQCAIFLENHPDYSAAHGYRVVFHLKYGSVQNSKNVNDQIIQTSYVQQHILESDRAFERWAGYMRHAYATQFYVQRKEVWRRMYRDVSLVRVTYLGPELMPCGLTSILGKVKQLDCLSTLFQATYNQGGAWITHSPFHFTLKPEWSQSVQGFRNSITEALMEKDNLSETEAREVFDREFWNHLNIHLAWPYQRKYGELPSNQIDIATNLTSSQESVYSLLTHPNWSHFVQVMKNDRIQAIMQQQGVDHETAQAIFEKNLWGHLLILSTWQYQRKYGAEEAVMPINREMAQERGLAHQYQQMLSLEALLNPSSPYHKDFMAVYQSVAGADETV